MARARASSTSRTILTVGHGARTLEDLCATLHHAGVGVLVDVRRFPGSRRHPHFAREALAQSIPRAGIAYEWQGEALGGRRSRVQQPTRHPALRHPAFQGYAEYMESAAFRDAVARLIARADAGEVLAVMCAETLWWQCHRRLIADALVLRGATVLHLMAAGAKPTPHALTDGVRADDAGWPVYDVGVTLPLATATEAAPARRSVRGVAKRRS